MNDFCLTPGLIPAWVCTLLKIFEGAVHIFLGCIALEYVDGNQNEYKILKH